jgi:hypothetical protein
MVVSIKIAALWYIALCGSDEVDQHFRCAYCLVTLMMEAVLPLKCLSASMMLYVTASKKAVIFKHVTCFHPFVGILLILYIFY